MSKDDSVRIRHMLDAARKAVQFSGGRSRQDLEKDEMLLLSLVRLLEVVGEAAKSVSDKTREQFPGVPWKDISGTRDRLIHGYFDVDPDVVWEIVTEDLPKLIKDLESSAG